YKLPDGTAISVLKSLQDEYFRTPVIIMTVHAQKSVALEALHLGAQDLLHKDKITPDSLERALRYAIERHRLMHELQCSKERERREQELRSYMEN
ncbi:response regulator, partial [Acinetobacter baumannii]